MANRWCVLGKLNLRLVLDYFSDSALFEGKRLQSYFLCEALLCRRVMKDIVSPKYIYPTTRYKQWLEDDMKWILKGEKAYMKTSNKERKTE